MSHLIIILIIEGIFFLFNDNFIEGKLRFFEPSLKFLQFKTVYFILIGTNRLVYYLRLYFFNLRFLTYCSLSCSLIVLFFPHHPLGVLNLFFVKLLLLPCSAYTIVLIGLVKFLK